MADLISSNMRARSTRIAPGVIRKCFNWARYYEGSQQALVTAGVARPDWFANLTGTDRRGRTVRTKRLTVDSRRVETTVPPRGPCVVLIRLTKAECAELQQCSHSEIEDARAINLHVSDTNERSRAAITKAESDPKFQHFLARLSIGKPDAPTAPN